MKKVNKRVNKKSTRKNMILNILILLCVLYICSIFINFNLAKKDIKTSEVIVENDDTIWSLAKQVCSGRNDLNIQNIIIEIKEINNLTSSDIYVGQVISLPIY